MPEMLNNVVSVYRPLRHIGGVQVYLPSFLTSEPEGDEWSTTRSSDFTHGNSPCNYWTVGHAVTQLVEAEVADSISDVVIRIFHWHNPSGRTMVLESNEPLTEMSTRNISWEIKAAGA
jgi:hypothetical protein